MLQTSGIVDKGTVECLRKLINDRVLGSAVYHEMTDSTNTLALNDIAASDNTASGLPRLYLADQQIAGRGRVGRTWHSSDDSLTLSVVVETSTLFPISLVAGVAVAEAVDAFITPASAQIKWPNDVYIQGTKVAGVLVEVNHKYPRIAVVGIGVNIQSAPIVHSTRDTSDTTVPAGSLAMFTTNSLNRFDVLDEIVRRLCALATAPDVALRFRDKCYLTGNHVTLTHAGHPAQGRCLGINEQGSLVVETETESGSERIIVQSGEALLIRRK